MAVTQEEHLQELSKGYRFDWKDADHSVFEPKRGLSPAVVQEISAQKSEPDWMRKFRLKALKRFERKPMLVVVRRTCRHRLRRHLLLPEADREGRSPTGTCSPRTMKATYEKLGIPEAERKYLAGVTAQFESEVVYHKNREELDKHGRPLHRHGHGAARVPGDRAASTSARSSRRATTSSPR